MATLKSKSVTLRADLITDKFQASSFRAVMRDLRAMATDENTYIYVVVDGRQVDTIAPAL